MTQLDANVTWNYTPAAGTSLVNEALLQAAKLLLQSLYTYTPGTPDYLPTSYTGEKTGQTSYFTHAGFYPKTDPVHPGAGHVTQVRWPAVDGSQVYWATVAGDDPAGWSGTVTQAGNFKLDPAEPTPQPLCVTDCSGFITALFAHVNNNSVKSVATVFTGWDAKAKNTVPEAGCFVDTNVPNPSLEKPNACNYYSFFVNKKYGFDDISLADVQPGDILAWAHSYDTDPDKTGSDGKPALKDPGDSGHIMLILAVADVANSNGKTKLVVVADESSGHTQDTRTAPGAGMGIVVLSTDNSENALKFYWDEVKYQNSKPQPGLVALGRARAA